MHVLLLASVTAFPTSLTPGGTTLLPASGSGQVLALLRIGGKGEKVSLARSYDGHPWERTQGGAQLALHCDQLNQCTFSVPGDEASYLIDAYTTTSGNEETLKAASRLLTQATFGPTRSEVHALSATMQQSDAAAIRSWLHAQMALNASLHREYYRRRVNTRTTLPSATGGVHSACTAGSRWHRFTFTATDKRKDVVVAGGGALGYTMSIEGSVRTEVAAGSPALPSAVGVYTLDYVEERVGGTIWLCPGSGASCKFAQSEQVINPPIAFGGAVDTSMTHLMSEADDTASLLPFGGGLMPNASLLAGDLACTQQLAAQPHIYLRALDGGYHRHDPRLVLQTNTLDHPAHLALTSGASISTEPRALTVAELDSSASALASAPTEVIIGEASGQFWNAIPSDPQSYTVSVGDVITFKYGAAHNVFVTTAEGKWGSCDKSGGAVLSGFHAGGGEGTGYLENLYRTTVTTAGTLYIVCAPHCSAGQKVQIHVLPRVRHPPPPPQPLASISVLPLPSVPKTFVNLDSCQVLLAAGDDGGREVCGSPGEVANEPWWGNQYNTYLTSIGEHTSSNALTSP